MVLASTSGLIVEWDSQNTCHMCLCHQREFQLSLQEALKDQQASGSDRLLIIASALGDLECEILSVPVKAKSLLTIAPHLAHVSPTGLQTRHPGGLDVLVHNLWVAVLMWGLDPSLLGENLCNCDWLSSSFVGHGPGYGSRLDWLPSNLSQCSSFFIFCCRESFLLLVFRTFWLVVALQIVVIFFGDRRKMWGQGLLTLPFCPPLQNSYYFKSYSFLFFLLFWVKVCEHRFW